MAVTTISDMEDTPHAPLELEAGNKSGQGVVVRETRSKNSQSQMCPIVTTVILALIALAFIISYLVIEHQTRTALDDVSEVCLHQLLIFSNRYL